MHDKPNNRGSWDPHSVSGWNIGTFMEHHWMFNLFAKATRAERVSCTVYFKHKYLTQPTFSAEDTIVAAAQQLTASLERNARSNNKELEDLTKVADLSEEIAKGKAVIA